MIIKDKNYLNWRYLNTPGNPYQAYLVVKNLEVIGYFILENKAILILELCGTNTLYDEILKNGYLNESKFIKIAKQICEGIQYCHNKGVVHLDIKPQNILMDEYFRPKIADFGFTKRY